MPQADPSPLDPLQQEALARDLAPDLSSVLITHYPDAETLDTFRPGESDVALVSEVNRAVASALVEAGVEVFVQVADRALFRRWMDGRPDTPKNRLAWRNRGSLLRGAAALEVLGVDPGKIRPAARPAGGKTSLSPADRLMRAFAGDDDRAFRLLAEDLITEGRQGVLGLAVRKVTERFGDDAAADLELELLEIAEGAAIGPSGWANLVALPVALPPEGLPDAEALGGSLLASGVLGEALEIRFLGAWRAAEAFEALEPVSRHGGGARARKLRPGRPARSFGARLRCPAGRAVRLGRADLGGPRRQWPAAYAAAGCERRCRRG